MVGFRVKYTFNEYSARCHAPKTQGLIPVQKAAQIFFSAETAILKHFGGFNTINNYNKLMYNNYIPNYDVKN